MRGYTLPAFIILLLMVFPLIGPLTALADVYSFVDSEGVIHFTNAPNDLRYKVFLRTGRPVRSVRQGSFFSGDPKKYDPAISAACQRFGVDTDLVKAVIKAESNFNYRAISPKGAQGLMQLMPATAREMSVFDPFDPVENIHGGVRYLKQLLTRFSGNISLALAAYNAGPERLTEKKQVPMIKETQDYIERVLTYFQKYKKKRGYQENNML